MLDALVVAVERTRFSTVAPTEQQGRDALSAAEVVGRALRQRVEDRARLQATWLPRSVTSPRRPAQATPVSTGGDRVRTGGQKSEDDRVRL
jgi:hypothetical protein